MGPTRPRYRGHLGWPARTALPDETGRHRAGADDRTTHRPLVLLPHAENLTQELGSVPDPVAFFNLCSQVRRPDFRAALVPRRGTRAGARQSGGRTAPV